MSFASPPTPAEIADAVERQRAARRAEPRSRAEDAAVADRIHADWGTAREQGRELPDLPSFVRDVARNASVTLPPPVVQQPAGVER
ncbi:hypothetical protein ABT142_14115 [Streptomyces sp. NPDC001857]|uniref:hypothetical protein n=1 Tax=unclassified Streptomyces TaxID=2593676 RepID=UPI00332EF4EE